MPTTSIYIYLINVHSTHIILDAVNRLTALNVIKYGKCVFEIPFFIFIYNIYNISHIFCFYECTIGQF